jgi:hypothetical protein
VVEVVLELSLVGQFVFVANECAFSPFSIFKGAVEPILLIPLFSPAFEHSLLELTVYAFPFCDDGSDS